MKKFIHENLKSGNPLNTDEWLGYKGLSKIFDHKVIKHNQKEYVKGDIHTNTIEGFWAILKRGIMGIYHSMSRKHLQRYVDEFVFRYNTRGFSESYRFDYVLNNINNRLTYKELKNVGSN